MNNTTEDKNLSFGDILVDYEIEEHDYYIYLGSSSYYSGTIYFFLIMAFQQYDVSNAKKEIESVLKEHYALTMIKGLRYIPNYRQLPEHDLDKQLLIDYLKVGFPDFDLSYIREYKE